MSIRTFMTAAATLCAFAPAFATAQLINGPFEFQRRGGGGEAVGMSTAYRQAILERELFGTRPRNLARDRSGALLEVVPGRSNQAFLRQQAAPFLVGPGGGGFGIGVGGFSIGGGRVTLGGLGYGGAGAGPVFLRWSSMLGDAEAATSWNGVGGGGATPAGDVIESWIMQLASLEGPEQ